MPKHNIFAQNRSKLCNIGYMMRVSLATVDKNILTAMGYFNAK